MQYTNRPVVNLFFLGRISVTRRIQFFSCTSFGLLQTRSFNPCFNFLYFVFPSYPPPLVSCCLVSSSPRYLFPRQLLPSFPAASSLPPLVTSSFVSCFPRLLLPRLLLILSPLPLSAASLVSCCLVSSSPRHLLPRQLLLSSPAASSPPHFVTSSLVSCFPRLLLPSSAASLVSCSPRQLLLLFPPPLVACSLASSMGLCFPGLAVAYFPSPSHSFLFMLQRLPRHEPLRKPGTIWPTAYGHKNKNICLNVTYILFFLYNIGDRRKLLKKYISYYHNY